MFESRALSGEALYRCLCLFSCNDGDLKCSGSFWLAGNRWPWVEGHKNEEADEGYFQKVYLNRNGSALNTRRVTTMAAEKIKFYVSYV